MKPLLSAPLTSWDQWVWDNQVWRGTMEEWDADHLQSVSVSADRRDAARMLAYRQARGLVGRGSGCILAGWETVLPGYDSYDVSLMQSGLAGYIPQLDITGCAIE